MARQKYIVVYVVWLMMLMPFAAIAEGRFEDADKSNDFLSQTTHQYFDLRHTIPGEPDIDYPIYGEVPRTSFSCANKHEGYYADIESRCQAFRICTHTAQNTAGFGFLCPNGTLFSQRHFVCDWYRNVRCEESERFYDKNRLNYVGNNYEMMEKVRHMIEYPMKTISKALQQNSNNSPRITVQKTQQKSAQLVKNLPVVAPITNTDNTQYYGNRAFGTVKPKTKTSFNTQKVLRAEEIKSLPLTNEANDDIYVNSLGELSTDPNAKFNAKTARIIGHPKKMATGRNLNFAESINYGLNDYRSGSSPSTATAAPIPTTAIRNLQKNTRDTKDESTLGSNLNLLKHEIIAELDTKVTGYQPQSTENERDFQFLSRGFSSQNNKIKSKNTYYYQPPKQTPSTVRFTSNELSRNSLNKNTTINILNKHNHDDDVHDGESIEFKFMPTTGKLSTTTVDSFLINAELFDLGSLSFDLGPESIETEISSTEDDGTQESKAVAATDEKPASSTKIPATPVSTTTPITTYTTTDNSVDTTTSTEVPTTITTTKAAPTNLTSYKKLSLELEAPPPQAEDVLLNSLDLSDLVQLLSDRKLPKQEATEGNPSRELPTEEAQEKINVNRHAEELFISGVQLAENSLENFNINNNNSKYNEDHTTTTTSTTTSSTTTTETPITETSKPIVSMEITKSEMVTEVNIIESRLRTRRRFKKPATTTTTTTTAATSLTRPGHLRRYMARNGTKTSTTTTEIPSREMSTETPAASKRQRQRKHRTTTTTSTTKPLLTANSEKNLYNELKTNDLTANNENRKIIARNINSNSNQSARANNFNNGLKKSTRYSQRRRTTKRPITTTTTTSDGMTITPAKYKLSWTQSSMRDRQAIIRARGSQNYHTRKQATSTTSTTTITTTTTTPSIKAKAEISPIEEIIATELFVTPLLNISLINTTDDSSTSSSSSSSLSTLSPALNSKLSNDLTFSTFINFKSIHNETDILPKGNATTTSTSTNTLQHEENIENLNFLPFDELTRAIVDKSILQNYHSNQHFVQQPQPKLYVQATGATTPTTTTKTNIYNNNKNRVQSTYTPSVLIARAEGQRIVPSALPSLPIPQYLQQQQQQQLEQQKKAPYVPLNDFLSNKFGQTQTSTKNIYTSHQQKQKYYPQYQHEQQQQQQQQQYNKPTNPFLSQQPQIKLPINPFLSHQQQKQQQTYFNKQQQQQQQLYNVENAQQQQQQQQYSTYNKNRESTNHFVQNNHNQLIENPSSNQYTNSFLNVKLPTLSDGLIPIPQIPYGQQTAQRRKDTFNFDINTTPSPRSNNIFQGASSYDVPLSSVGRLPNDMQRLRKIKK